MKYLLSLMTATAISALSPMSANAEFGLCIFQDENSIPLQFQNEWVNSNITSVAIIHTFSRDRMAVEVRAFDQNDLAHKLAVTKKGGGVTLRAHNWEEVSANVAAKDYWTIIAGRVAPDAPTVPVLDDNGKPKKDAEGKPITTKKSTVFVLSNQGPGPTLSAIINALSGISSGDINGIVQSATGVDPKGTLWQGAATIEPVLAKIFGNIIALQLPTDLQHTSEASFSCDMEDIKKPLVPVTIKVGYDPAYPNKEPGKYDQRTVTLVMPGEKRHRVLGRLVETPYTADNILNKMTQIPGAAGSK